MSDEARDLRRALVAALRARGVLRSPAVEAAFLAVPRERCLAAAGVECSLVEAYRDDAIVTRIDTHGRPRSSTSQPALMAEMLEQLAVQPGQHVLEIGAGTGYNAALLAVLVGPAGRVTTVDVDPDVATGAARALEALGAGVAVRIGDGRRGDAAGAPYDCIMVTASAASVPAAWRDQLRDGGRLQVPLQIDPDGSAIQIIPVLERRGDELVSTSLSWGGFMPLHGGDGGYRPAPPRLSATLGTVETQTDLVTLVGRGVEQLSPETARLRLAELLAQTVAPVREGTISMSSRRPPLLVLYLLLAVPEERRLSIGPGARMGVGIVDGERGGIGLLTFPSPWTRNARDAGETAAWRLVALGDRGAAAELGALLDRWEILAADGPPTLSVTAGGAGDPLGLTFSWSPGRPPSRPSPDGIRSRRR